MHKGTAYPYHWYYWATECQFWPGFAAWQIAIAPMSPNVAPWNVVNPTVGIHSDNGHIVPDATQIYWDFLLNTGPGFSSLRVSLEQELIGSSLYAVWKATLSTPLITGPSVWFFQPAPRRVFGVPNANWWLVHDPLAVAAGPHLAFRAATWAEISDQPHR